MCLDCKFTKSVWSSKTSESIGKFYAENKTITEIANELFISEKTVQAYDVGGIQGYINF